MSPWVTKSSSSPASSGSSGSGAMTRSPRRIVGSTLSPGSGAPPPRRPDPRGAPAQDRGEPRLPGQRALAHRPADPRGVLGQGDLHQVGGALPEAHQPDDV